MRSNRFILGLALVLFASACVRISEEIEVPVAQSPSEDSFVSKVSGKIIPLDAVQNASIIVKLNEDLTAELEKSGMHTSHFAKIRPLRMNRLFPHAGEFEERTREAGLHRWYKIEFDESVSLADAELALYGIDELETVEFDYKIQNADYQLTYPESYSSLQSKATDVFNDPMLSQQWHYYNDGSRQGTMAGCDVDVLTVWDSFASGSSDVIVNIVDGGIDLTHEDLAANIWKNSSGKSGYNFIDNNYEILAHDHGTHVAGTVAAVNNNGLGVCGIAGGDAAKGVPGVKLMSSQIFKKGPDGNDLSGPGHLAIKWGADNGAVISQNSWSYVKASSTPAYCIEAIDYFIKYAGMDSSGKNQVGPMAGGVVIFAAGNDAVNIGYPGSYEPVIAVSSVGADYRIAYYSNYGDWCDIIAPGGDAQKGFNVLSTVPGSYGYMQGTSMACPHVSGVAALIVANLGGEGFTNKKLEELLISAVNTEVLEYNTRPMGAGLVSATNAIATNRPVEHFIEPETSSTLMMKAPQTRQIAFLVNNPTGHMIQYTLSPQIEGVTVRRDPDNLAKRVIVEVCAPEVLGDKWNQAFNRSFTLTATCEQEPSEQHSIDFNLNISANNTPIILKKIDGIVADKLDETIRINIDGVFFDSDGESLNYKVSETPLGAFTMNGNQLTFKASAFGSGDVQVTASDMFGAQVSETIKLLVRDSSRPGGSGQIDIYPNPVVDKLNLRTSDEISANVQIFSVSGACVFDSKLEIAPFAPAQVDMTNMPAGTYTIKVKGSGVDFSGNVVKI